MAHVSNTSSSSAVSRVPYNVWQQVSQLVPAWFLCKLYSVNRALFYISFDAIYHDVRWESVNLQMIKTLIRLRDPFIAKRVRKLHVSMRLLDGFFRSSTPFSVNGHIEAPSFLSLCDWLIRCLKWKKSTLSDHGLLIAFKSGYLLSHPDWLLAVIQDVVSRMHYVEGYSINSAVHPLHGLSLIHQHWVWRILHRRLHSLHKLTLHIQVADAGRFLSSVYIGNLQDLELILASGCLDECNRQAVSRRRHYEESISTDVIAHFVNQHSSTLHRLVLISFASLDLSSFFRNLAPFPLLHSLELCMTFEAERLSDPSGIIRLIHNHSPTLTHISLRPKVYMPVGMSGQVYSRSPSMWYAFENQLYRITLVLPRLQSMMIHTTSQHFSRTCDFLRRSTRTLTQLHLTDRLLQYSEVNTLIDNLCHENEAPGLMRLELGVWALSPRVFDLLALRLTSLSFLKLTFNHVGGSLGVDLNIGPPSGELRRHGLEAFWEEMNPRIYNSWGLHELKLWANQYDDFTIVTEYKTMQLLMRSIPQLRVFNNREVPCVPGPPPPW